MWLSALYEDRTADKRRQEAIPYMILLPGKTGRRCSSPDIEPGPACDLPSEQKGEGNPSPFCILGPLFVKSASARDSDSSGDADLGHLAQIERSVDLVIREHLLTFHE